MEIVPIKPTKYLPTPITLENYNERAHKFAVESGNMAFPTITPETPECKAWERYFDLHLGGRPWAYQALMSGQIQAMTVPTQWPEWFDQSFTSAPQK